MSNASLHLSCEAESRWGQILLVLLIAYGALLRITRLFTDPDFVSPDALKHFMAAEQFQGGEPLGWFAPYRGYAPFAWILRLLFGLSSHQPVIQRLVTVLFSVLVIYLVARIVRARLGEWMGLFAAYLAATNPALIESADTGIREDPYAVLWLLLFLVVFVWRPTVSPPHSGPHPATLRRVSMGLVACILFLVRVDSFPALAGFLVLVVLSQGVWKNPREWCEALVPVVLLFGIVLISNGMIHEDPFYFVDREKSIFRWWANVEFKGQPGFPTVEEVNANCRAGEPLSAFQYFGEVLGWRETASRFLSGYVRLFTKHALTGIYRFEAFPNQISFVGILTVLGIMTELFRKRWVIPVLIPLLLSGTAWTYSIVGGHDFRLFLIAVPFAILAACEGAGFVWSQLERIPWIWLRRVAVLIAMGLAVYNPWNHDRKTSFPWRVGPVDAVPVQCRYDSAHEASSPRKGESTATSQPSGSRQVVHLVGLEFREIGPLGLWNPPLTHLVPRHRFLVRTWWQVPRAVSGSASYRVATYQAGKGYLGAARYQPLTRKYPLRFWQAGQVVLDEVECWVYSRANPGLAELRVEVAGDGVIEDATYTAVFNVD